MNVIITGSTGMIGSLLLDLSTKSNQILKVTTLVRSQNKDVKDKKVNTVLIKDFKTYDNQKEIFKNIDAVFFCLGAYTGKVPKDLFKEITVDYAVNCAKLLATESPRARFCLLSGAGADQTEKSRTSFARFKGMAENQISETNLEFYSFRPGYIYPVKPRKEPSFMYQILRTLYPFLRLFGNNSSIKSTELASAMFNIGLNGAENKILENRDILKHI